MSKAIVQPDPTIEALQSKLAAAEEQGMRLRVEAEHKVWARVVRIAYMSVDGWCLYIPAWAPQIEEERILQSLFDDGILEKSHRRGDGIEYRITASGRVEYARRNPADAALLNVERKAHIMLAALRSIAANTCCGSCQEAALVAKFAIAQADGYSDPSPADRLTQDHPQ